MNGPCVIFSVSGELFALPFADAREVIRPGSPHHVPRAPFACLGAIDLRGERVPLLSVGVLLALHAPLKGDEKNRRLFEGHGLIIGLEGRRYGLLVDRVIDISVDPEYATPAGSAVLRLGRAAGLVLGAVRWGEQTAWLLDTAGLLGRGRIKLLDLAAERAGA